MKIYMSTIAVAAALLLVINNSSQANNHTTATKVGNLIFSNVWARITPKIAKTGAAFFVVENISKIDDILVGVSSRIAKKTQIHHSSEVNNVMKMRHVGKVTLPAGSTTELKPGSFHIMFMGLHAPIKEGDFFPLTLTFKLSGIVTIMVRASKV